jgi:sulfhydrogenase subunit beta (sulfur reductase)
VRRESRGGGVDVDYTITRKKLARFLERLQEERELVAPVRTGWDTVFDVVKDVADIDLDYTNTVKPPKEFFLAQQEVLFEYKKSSSDISSKKRVLFGIRPCDLAGLASMDYTFKEGEQDIHYLQKRRNTVIIALGCTRLCDDNAFCESMGAGPVASDYYDLQLVELDKTKYLVLVGSKRGRRIIKEHSNLVSKTRKPPIREVRFKKRIDPKKLMERLESLFDDEGLWVESSKTCIRCAACNYLCPSCFCFNVSDTSRQRMRGWDSCMLRGFTREASSHIPRNELSTRFRQRMYHKYKWHYERYGQHMCTGCGRCVTYCPGHVPYIELMNRITDDG